ncbi:hypothetical protein MHYP_G00262060 [Metynnis hypsauchen]
MFENLVMMRGRWARSYISHHVAAQCIDTFRSVGRALAWRHPFPTRGGGAQAYFCLAVAGLPETRRSASIYGGLGTGLSDSLGGTVTPSSGSVKLQLPELSWRSHGC